MELELTAFFRRVPEGYIAFVEELPAANTQGGTRHASTGAAHAQSPFGCKSLNQ